MIDEFTLDEWSAQADKLSKEQVLMLISQLKAYQRNSTIVYVFPQQFFDVSDNKFGATSDAMITPEKLRGFVLEKTVNADYYFASATKMMPQDQPVSQPPIVTPPPPKPKPQRIITNQEVINAFFEIHGDNGWSELVKVVGSWAANYEMAENRIMTFVNPEILPKEVIDVLSR